MENYQNEVTATDHPLSIVSPGSLLAHWQGHRSLTRKLIEAYPENKLFTFSIGGMRTFAEILMELIGMEAPGIKGIATGKWEPLNEHISHQNSKKEILRLWDSATAEINGYWVQITPEHFKEVVVAFGQYENKAIDTIFYFIDNEIHHRGQGYVYLRSLGITPPSFWERE